MDMIHSEKEKQIFEMYSRLNIPCSGICKECRKDIPRLSPPVSVWQVGEEFDNSKYRVLFVGKNAREEEPEGGIPLWVDGTEYAEDLFRESGWAYWRYTREIAEALYGENAWEKIAFTNLVKCDFSLTIDTTTPQMKAHCITDLGVFVKEAEIIRPKNIVFYTARDYDPYISKLFGIDLGGGTRKIGAREMPWFSGRGISFHGEELNILRVGHPQCKKKADFCTAVAEWIAGG